MSTIISQCVVESLEECLGKDDYVIKFLRPDPDKKRPKQPVKLESFIQLKKVA